MEKLLESDALQETVVPSEAPPAHSKHKYKPKYRKSDNIFGLVTTLIPLVAFLFFSGSVLVIGFISQFTEMEYYDVSSMKWNNFETFKRIFSDSRFVHSIVITLWLLCSEFVSLLISLGVSVLLSKNVKGSKLMQVLYFIPYICSSVASALIWMRMFDYEHGIINSMLTGIFGEGARVPWKSDAAAFTWQLFIVNVWKAPGYGIVMYKAAMMNVDPGLYEAAKLDGAGPLTQFWKITLPSIAPTTFYLLIAGGIAGLMTFEIPRIFVGNSWDGSAGVQDAGLSIVLYSYIRATTYHDIPGASVMSFTLFAACFTLSLILFKVRSKFEGED